jgi:class 3 adenylate cyclase/DNA-binding response OmpR family regulator
MPALDRVVNVLVIDSDLETQRQLEKLTSGTDLVRVLALTEEDGARLAREKSPGIIFVNAGLPGEDGLKGLLALRVETEDTPIIVITEHESCEQATSAFRWGACDYLSKPLDPDELAKAIERAQKTSEAIGERHRLTQRLIETTETLQRQQQELNAVHVIGRLTTSILDLDVVLDRLTEIAVHLTDAQASILLLREEDGDQLYLRAAKNLQVELADTVQITLDGVSAGRAVRTRRPVLVTGDQAQIVPGRPSESLLLMPLQVPDRVIGLLGLCSWESKEAFSQRDVFLLSNLVDYAAIAIENARLFEGTANAKSLMDAVFSSIASGVVTLDRDDQVTLVNRAAKQILRAPGAEAGSPLCEVAPEFEIRVKPWIDQVRRVDEPRGPVEIDLPLASGELVNLLLNLSPLKQVPESHWASPTAKEESSRGIQVDAQTQARPSGSGAVTGGVTIVIDDVTEQRKLESRFRLFQRYLSPTVIERLPDDPQELELGGVRQEIASLFADIRGFVNFSMQHPPEKLVETLNKYLGASAEAVLSEEGTLDKFVGDAVVAFFNAPLAQDDYVMRAVRTAIKIREATAQLREELATEHRLAYGIGVSVGTAIVGNIGTPRRLDYTAIGPSVNAANQLQAVAKPGQILLTAAVYERTKEYIVAHPVPLEPAAGSKEPTIAYALVDLARPGSLVPTSRPWQEDGDA